MKAPQKKRITSRPKPKKRVTDVRCRTLFEQSPYGVLVIDLDGNLLDFNEAAHRQLGYTREEFGNLTIADLNPVQSPDEIKRHFHEVMKKGTAEFAVKHRAKNGDLRDVHVITKAITLAGNTVFHSIWRDMTEEKRSEAAIQQSERKFRTLFDSADDAIFILDLDGNFIDINKAAYSRLGYTREEMLSLHVSRLHSPRFASKVPERLVMVRRQGHGVVHSEHVKKDGGIMPVEINARVVDYDGQKAIFSIVRDITDRKKAEDARIESEKRYHALFDNIPLGIVLVDIDRRIVDCNRSFENMIGYTAAELKTMTIPEISHAEDDLATRKYYHAMMDGKANSFTMEKRHIRKDGTLIWTNLTGTLIRDEKNGPQLLFGIVEDITERKKAEESLLLFTNLLNQSNEAIFVNDPATGRFLIVNDKACSNLGYSRGELLNLRTLDIEAIFPDQAAWDAHVREVKQQGYLLLEGKNKRQDGTLFPVEVNVTYMALGGKDYMVAVVRDITERKTAERALRLSEERLSKAQKTAHVGNWEENIAEGCLYWSEEVYWIYGVDPERFAPSFKAVEKAMHPDDREPFLKAVHAAIYDRAHLEMDYRLIRPDGTERTVHTIGAAEYDDAGKPRMLSGTVQDITERKKMEEALRGSRDFIENILNTVDEAFIVIDRDYRIQLANHAYATQAGMPLQEIIGRHCHEVSHASSMPCFEAGEDCSVRSCFETGEPRSCLHRHTSKDGSILYVETKAFPLKDASGRVTSAIEVINNITDRHLLEEQILRTQKLEAVGLLAGGIAHDFNNLLQGVFGSISMAKTFSDSGGKAHDMLESAEAALHQAMNLTKQLLTFSKGGEPVKKVIALPSVVDSAARFALSGSNINYRSVYDERLPTVEADEGQITQVIHNIVLNACEAMPGGGTVSIDAQTIAVTEANGLPLQPGTYMRIEIRDSGAGIPENIISKIFDPYFTTKERGSGLGLATSYSILKRHGGLITASSQPGAGSTFAIYLPASEEKAAVERSTAGVVVRGRGRILVMDDEEIVRTVAWHMMTSLGYEVDLVENGEQAVDRYTDALKSGKPFDAVILDLTVRGGSGGKETIGKLRELHPAVKAIVSSGYSAEGILGHYQDYGFLDVLTKPYQIDELSKVLHAVVHSGGRTPE